VDYVWSPWRYPYMEQVNKEKQPECIFCEALARGDDAESLIVHRGKKAFVILNRFPYTSGHVMIVPYAHVATFKPDGMNLGMNLGKAAGAGVAGHLHLHALPRWFGDTNFLTVTGETRVHPEDLRMTYDKMRKALTD